MVESHSTIGLVIVSKLYSEGKIDDESREKLKGKLILPHKLCRYDIF